MRTTSVGLSAVPALRGPTAVASVKRIETSAAVDAAEPAAIEAVKTMNSKVTFLKMALLVAIVILFVGAMVAPVMAHDDGEKERFCLRLGDKLLLLTADE